MRPTSAFAEEPFTRAFQAYLLFMALGLFGLLATARCLRPDSAGHGTHEQLGLPPCTFYLIFGRPCPSCGMTTSWALLMRGDLYDAAKANAGGMLLGLGCMAMSPWFLASALRRRWLGFVPSPEVTLCFLFPVMFVTFAQWAWRMYEMGLK
jgi:hypothetical protein